MQIRLLQEQAKTKVFRTQTKLLTMPDCQTAFLQVLSFFSAPP
jgi:hypothetical protein